MFFICISKMAARNVVTNIICFTRQPIAPACGADVPSARIRVATGAQLHAGARDRHTIVAAIGNAPCTSGIHIFLISHYFQLQ